MRSEVVPSEVLDVISFLPSPFSKHVSDENENSVGGISKNGLWLWLVKGSVVEIYRTEGRERRGGYCFRDSSKTPLLITASAQIQSSHLPFPCLLIALDIDPDGSLLCLFNANALRVVRVLRLPYRVTAIEVISGDGGACMETLQLNLHLRCMFGLVAVGTESGHVFLVDLCLDEEYDSDISSPNKSIYVNKQSFSPKKRESVISKQQHICMVLNDNSFSGDSFEFRTYSSLIARYPSDDVFVSSLKYIRSLATLVLGFNFDGVQLWNLQLVTLQYTIENPSFLLPVVSFAFQEPENDPRHFCYLWVVRGYQQQERPEHTSVATLYSLSYRKREWIKSFGPFYSELNSCNKRFEYPLSADPCTPMYQNGSYNSRLISCQVITQNDAGNIFGHSAVFQNESESSSEELSLCFISWEMYATNGNSISSSYLLLFDINQWYQAQMPSLFGCDANELSPYLGVFSLQRVSQKLNMKPLLGVCAIPHSLKKIKYLSTAEEFFYPSSHGFQMWCFSSNCLTLATFLGFQRQLLFELTDDVPKYLNNPSEILALFITSGLLSDLHIYNTSTPLSMQRETLMQLALENHLPSFFMKCMQEFRFSFSDGGVQDFSSRIILNWSWKKVISIKGSIDKLSQPLFNCSGIGIDKLSLKTLHSYKRQLNLIDSIFVGYEKYTLLRTDQEKQEICIKRNVISSINTYLQVLLWLHHNHILPETCEGDESKEIITYPAFSINELYSSLRSQLQEIHSSVKSSDLLLIDGLVLEAGVGQIWLEKGGQDYYPPPSVYAALSLYLVDGISFTQKHMLMYYILLDIISLLPDHQISFLPQIKTFLPVFDVSSSNAKLTEAFWFLDHQHFEPAIKKLMEPGLRTTDILPWQHRRVIKSFLFQGEPHKALRYINNMRPPEASVEDKKLHLSVLLARGLISRAFEYQREIQNSSDSEELFCHFLIGCQETRSLKILVYLPLNAFEVSTLIKFLDNNEDPKAQEILVMYHLLRYNFFEAAKVNEKLLSCSKELSASTWERAPYRNALVESFLGTVSKAEKVFADELKNVPVKTSRAESFPKPLSANFTSSSLRQISYSDLLNSVVHHSAAVQNSQNQTLTPLQASSQSCYDSVPFLRPTVTPESSRRPDVCRTPLSLPKKNMSIMSETTSPVKRSRLLDNSLRNSDSFKERTPKHLARDIASLLQTPPIQRRGSLVLSKSSFAAGTPQSILKKITRPSCSTEENAYTARTPSVCSLESEDCESEMPCEENDYIAENIAMDVESHSRQIRFKSPSPARSSPDSLEGPSPVLENLKSKLNFSMAFPSPFLSKQHSSSEAITSTPALHKEPHLEIREDHFPAEPLNSSRIQPRKSFSSHSYVTIPAKPEESFTILPQEENMQMSDPLMRLGDENPIVQPSDSLSLKTSESLIERHLCFNESHYESPALPPKELVDEIPRDSMSGGSSYSSASERSFVVSPRRPLRDTSQTSIHEPCQSEAIQTDETEEQILLSAKSSFNVSDYDIRSADVSMPNKSIEQSDIAERCRDRLDFLSKTSDHNNIKLIKETDRLLGITQQPCPFDEKFRTKTDRTYVFTKKSSPVQQMESKSNSQTIVDTATENVVAEEIIVFPTKSKLFQECENETYEKFSQSLKGVTPARAEQHRTFCVAEKMTTESSPVFQDATDFQKPYSVASWSAKKPNDSLICRTPESKSLSVQKKKSSTKPSTSKQGKSISDSVAGSAKNKQNTSSRTKKSRLTQKLEFSFAEPNSPVGPEIMEAQVSLPEYPVHSLVFSPPATRARVRQKKLEETMVMEALASPPEYPVHSFVFSPPATRARVRQKKLEETMGSSFASFISEKSFTKDRHPPIDPLLQDIIQQSSMDIDKPSKHPPSSQNKTTSRKTSMKKAAGRKSVLNLISPMPMSIESSAEDEKQQAMKSARHSMVLRQTIKKKKFVKLFKS